MTAVAAAAPPLRCHWLGRVGYADARALQRRLAAARASGAVPDSLVLLEHPPVYTLGRNTEPGHLPAGEEALRRLGAEVHHVDRGGSVTFHGPGQLVAYPIVGLASMFPIAAHPLAGDVHRYLRALESALCAACAAAGVEAAPRPPYTGAWVGRRKIAAIGVKLSHGVTQHGVALNVSTDLGWFDAIVPCGIPGDAGGVTTLERCGASGWTPARMAPVLAAAMASALGRAPLHAGREGLP